MTVDSESSQNVEYVFQAEINELMGLIINSFYSNREIFIRELISNSSDAIDKHRFETLSSDGVITDNYKIQIVPDKQAKTLSIIDNGVGMTREELVSNLGTIAKSGTKAFMETMQKSENKESLIGQFGVGFYSAFLVSDTVDVYSTKNNITHLWSSNAGGKFVVRRCDTEDNNDNNDKHGTTIVLHMKEDQCEFIEETRIKELVQKHNGFINFPIELQVTKTLDTGEETDNKDEEKQESVSEFVVINTEKPIWTKKTEDVTPEEYSNFYKAITNDWDEPLSHKHFSVEGQLEFKGLLYIPKKAPFDLFTDATTKHNNIKLYVKKVFVTDDSQFLCPDWMGFVKGIIDCDDLPLNISRENLQNSKVLKVIKKNVEKKVIEMIQNLEDDEGKTFYNEFSKSLKIAVCNDTSNKTKICKLLKYHNIQNDELITLSQYVTNMKEHQQSIYYLCGDDINVMKKSKTFERFKKQGFNVLLMDETIDEYLVQQLREFHHDDKTFEMQPINRDGLDIPGEDKFEDDSELIDFCNAVKSHCGVEKIIQTDKIEDPFSILSTAYGWSSNMQRIMKAQALASNDVMASKKILEINVYHPLIIRLSTQFKLTKSFNPINKHILSMLFETASIAAGYDLLDPASYCSKIYKVFESFEIEEADETETGYPHTPDEHNTDSEHTPDMEQVD